MVDGERTDHGYKLTNEPKGSGELKNLNGILCLLVFSFTIKLLVKTVHRQLWSCFIHNQYN